MGRQCEQTTCPRLLPCRIVAWLGCEPRTSRPESQCVNHYATEPRNRLKVVACLSVCLSICVSASVFNIVLSSFVRSSGKYSDNDFEYVTEELCESV